jgi:hypothetical protein
MHVNLSVIYKKISTPRQYITCLILLFFFKKNIYKRFLDNFPFQLLMGKIALVIIIPFSENPLTFNVIKSLIVIRRKRSVWIEKLQKRNTHGVNTYYGKELTNLVQLPFHHFMLSTIGDSRLFV